MERGYSNASWENLWKLFFMVVLGWILFHARDVVAVLILAIVVSTAFDPIVSYLERKRIPRILGTSLLYLIAFIFLALVLYTLVPVAIVELRNLLDYAKQFSGSTGDFLNLDALSEQFGVSFGKASDLLTSSTFSIFDLASGFFGGVIAAITVFVISFYLTIGRNGVEKFLVAVLPAAYEPRILRLYERVAKKIGRWFVGQLLVSLIVGGIVFLGLALLGVRYSLLLAILAGLSEIVPYAGAIFTGIVSTLIGLSDSLSLGFYVLILFLVVQQIENHILVPAVMRYTTTLNPAVVLAALLIGGKVFGVVGVILSIPVAVFFQELIGDWAESKRVNAS
jgi:predicted PurR-regulated permease PerM